MQKHVLIKVLGFSDVERHALNSLLRISQQRSPSFDLWTTASLGGPAALMIDGRMVQAANEAVQASMQHPNARLLWFGAHAPAQAWQVFDRPIPWVRVLGAMDKAHSLSLAAQGVGVQGLGAQGEQTSASGLAQADFMDTAPAQAEPSTDRVGRKKILIADDDLTARLYLRAKLASLNLTLVDEACSGHEALQMAQQNHYDAVFLDIDMPPGNGFEVCRAIKRQARSPSASPSIGQSNTHTKVIFLTSRDGIIDRVRGNLVGADAYVTKPPQPARLSEIILSL
jgi:CheY-like chemotaxis protein